MSARLVVSLLALLLAGACAAPAPRTENAGLPEPAVLDVMEPVQAEVGAAGAETLRSAALRMRVDAADLARATTIRLEPFPEIRRTSVESEGGVVRWAGRTPDGQRAFLAAEGRVLVGLVCGGARNWRYRHVQGDVLAADEVDPSRLPGCGVREEAASGDTASVPGEPAAEPRAIDLLVLFTQKAAHGAMRLEAEAQAFASTCAFQDSGAPVRFRVAECRTVDFPESGSSETDLARLRDDADVERVRREVGAEQVTLLVSGFRDGNGGLSYLLTQESRERHRALAVVQRASLADLTFPHELAHNLGCGHEGAGPGLTSYAHAFVDPLGRFRTLDAQGGLPQPRIPRLSSTTAPWEGLATGAPTADNARVVRGAAAQTPPWWGIGALLALVVLLRLRRR